MSKKHPLPNDVFDWSELKTTYNEISAAICEQIVSLQQVSVMYAKIIEESKEIKEIVIGLSKSFEDLASDLAKIRESHVDVINDELVFKTGVIHNKDDAVLDFIKTQRDYENIRFALADTAAIAFIDLLTRLKADVTYIDTITEARNKALAVLNAANGATDGK